MAKYQEGLPVNQNTTWWFWETLKCPIHGHDRVFQNLLPPNLRSHLHLITNICSLMIKWTSIFPFCFYFCFVSLFYLLVFLLFGLMKNKTITVKTMTKIFKPVTAIECSEPKDAALMVIPLKHSTLLGIEITLGASGISYKSINWQTLYSFSWSSLSTVATKPYKDYLRSQF